MEIGSAPSRTTTDGITEAVAARQARRHCRVRGPCRDGVIGFVGLGAETGLWYAIKRQDQSAADAAVISGARNRRWPTVLRHMWLGET
jgi:hypothetical protein